GHSDYSGKSDCGRVRLASDRRLVIPRPIDSLAPRTGDPTVKSLPTFLCIAAVAALLPISARAADMEHRTYAVPVYGKPAGEMKMTMQTLDDGTQLMAGQNVLTTKRGNDSFRSSYRGLETWKDGRLKKYEAFSDDDEKKRHLIGSPKDGKFRVTVNGQ